LRLGRHGRTGELKLRLGEAWPYWRTKVEVRGGMAVLENFTLMFDASKHLSIKKMRALFVEI
jgi:hypothetical protein